MNAYAPTARYTQARPTVYPQLRPLQTYSVPSRPGTPVTAAAVHMGQLEAAKEQAKTGSQRSTQLKSLVAFFVFWVVVSSLFLLLYVDRMI